MTALRILLGIVILVIVVLVNTVVVMWCERKWAGHLQSRLGPMRTGWHGLMQPFADALKMLREKRGVFFQSLCEGQQNDIFGKSIAQIGAVGAVHKNKGVG